MKRIFILTALVFFSFQVNAQESRRERIKSLKVAYLTEKLELLPDEAAIFWPRYNQYDDTLFELKSTLNTLQQTVVRGDMNTMSKAEALSTLEEISGLKDEIARTESLFRKETPELLGARKALLLDIHEELFKKELLKRLQARRAARNDH
ncbi:hypothetical protein [Robertkochia flava]|uniref:hypothetical protein n=1 Tax=Robertkochia flava TaxID=3447986 RepID=UPI001CCD7AC0|nr:hypothetical protein [Robertkochia marina]